MTLMPEHPMSPEMASDSAPYQALCRTLLEMDVPAGYRAEIIGGGTSSCHRGRRATTSQ
jgi:hypothetical protein